MIVLLEDLTVGTCEQTTIGTETTVHLRDQNGNDIQVTGKVLEILEDDKA